MRKTFCLLLVLFLIISPLNIQATQAKEISWMQISTGDAHSVALKADGTLWAWGQNYYGQIGDGTTTDKTKPTYIMKDVKSISTGIFNTYAIKNDNTLWAWGNNEYGQLCDGTYTNRLKPVKIMDDVHSVSAGYGHILVIKNDGTLWSSGWNLYGQLGDGTNIDRTTPVLIMSDVKSVYSKYHSSFAIKNDGTLWAWGSNDKGQLGDGTTVDKTVPIKIMSDVMSVSNGYDHTLILKKDGALWTCGYNEYGQMGDGMTKDSSTPIKIMNDVWSISAGGNFSLALKNDYTLYAWGRNSCGQLGDGTTTDILIPKKIMGDVQLFSAGGGHILIEKAVGQIWTWGDNEYGQLGDGSVSGKLVPKDIGIDSSTNNVQPTSLKFTENKILLNVGSSMKLNYSVAPSQASQSVLWSCNNTKVATVKNGTVTIAKQAKIGSAAQIMCTSKVNPKIKATCTVIVSDATVISVSSSSTAITSGDRVNFSVKTSKAATNIMIKNNAGEILYSGGKSSKYGVTFSDYRSIRTWTVPCIIKTPGDSIVFSASAGNKLGYVNISKSLKITVKEKSSDSGSVKYYSSNVGKRIADVFDKNYNDGITGECVWYVRGRAKEKLGIDTGIRGNANKWYGQSKNKGTQIRSNSIACFNGGNYGHVLFVEFVDGDTIYYTEANTEKPLRDGKVSRLDGVLKVCSMDVFVKKVGGSLQGYIYLGK